MKRREALAAADWIAKSSPMAAAEWYLGLEEAIESLADMPTRCPIAADTGTSGTGVRQLLFGSHRILFVIRANSEYVVHVRHAARKPM